MYFCLLFSFYKRFIILKITISSLRAYKDILAIKNDSSTENWDYDFCNDFFQIIGFGKQ